MPPHRRRPAPNTAQTPPVRRPKVAGLRNRQDQSTPTEVELEQESVKHVLNGVRGTPPPPRRRSATDLAEPEAEAEAETDLADETAVLPRITDVPETEPEDAEPEPDVVESEDEQEDAEPTKSASEGTAGTRTKTKPRPKVAATPVTKGSTRPAGKRRATGTARPTDLDAAESDAGSSRRRPTRHAKVEERPTRTLGQKQLSLAIALAVVAVVLTGAAVFFRGKTNDLTSVDTNTALTDSATTSQVKGQLTSAIKQTFSYNYTDLDSTAKAVKEVLTGKALCQYDQLFSQVKQLAPQQKIILDTTVRELAVTRIDGDRAEALVFIDQLSTRVDLGKTVAVAAQLGVQARRDGDHWKITGFDMFGQNLVDGSKVPTC